MEAANGDRGREMRVIDAAEEAWTDLIPEHDWEVCRKALAAVETAGVDFLLGGGFAFSVYTKHWRNTKDLDLVTPPANRAALIEALGRAGFSDYYEQRPYDRGWIYRGASDGFIVDIIWRMANRRADVDASWLQHARWGRIRGARVGIVAAEELLWQKLYVLQRDRCDWPDVLNLISAKADTMDWKRVLTRLEGDWPLLKAVLTVFAWLCPGRAERVPEWLRERVGVAVPGADAGCHIERAQLLDTRAWMIEFRASTEPLDI